LLREFEEEDPLENVLEEINTQNNTLKSTSKSIFVFFTRIKVKKDLFTRENYKFDKIFEETASQENLFSHTLPLLLNFIEGKPAAIITYPQVLQFYTNN